VQIKKEGKKEGKKEREKRKRKKRVTIIMEGKRQLQYRPTAYPFISVCILAMIWSLTSVKIKK
jgi:hypothetical protein